MSLGTKHKDPRETRPFVFDWTGHLPSGVTVSSVVFEVADGLTPTNPGIVTGSGNLKTSVTLAGGTVGRNYQVRCTATLSDGTSRVRSGIVHVQDL